jgi:hypothetical protein
MGFRFGSKEGVKRRLRVSTYHVVKVIATNIGGSQIALPVSKMTPIPKSTTFCGIELVAQPCFVTPYGDTRVTR